MAYIIDACLEEGAPSLTITDATTGKQRLHWRGDEAFDGSYDWHRLFKDLVLLSCADRMSLIRRANSAEFGNECIRCVSCVDHRP